MSKQFLLSLSSPKNRGYGVIFSLPQTNQYQEISNLEIQKLTNYVIREIEGNKVLILNDVNDKAAIFFSIHVRPYKVNVDPLATIKDYRHPISCHDRFVNGRDKKIRVLSKKIVGKQTGLNGILLSLYNFTLEYLTYGRPIDGLYTYKQAMEERTTDCGGFSTFLMSLLQSIGIPTRLVSGFLIKENKIKNIGSMLHVKCYMFHDLLMHAWLEVQLPDKSWFPMDPSIEWRRQKGLTNRQGGFGFIPANRLVVSFGHDFQIKHGHRSYKIDLLQKPVYI